MSGVRRGLRREGWAGAVRSVDWTESREGRAAGVGGIQEASIRVNHQLRTSFSSLMDST